MDKITKNLKKINKQDRLKLQNILSRIIDRDFKNLDIKKLKGHDNVYRIRFGQYRIIFRNRNGEIMILDLAKRSDSIYKL